MSSQRVVRILVSGSGHGSRQQLPSHSILERIRAALTKIAVFIEAVRRSAHSRQYIMRSVAARHPLRPRYLPGNPVFVRIVFIRFHRHASRTAALRIRQLPVKIEGINGRLRSFRRRHRQARDAAAQVVFRPGAVYFPPAQCIDPLLLTAQLVVCLSHLQLAVLHPRYASVRAAAVERERSVLD
ncbi:hypothetical protein D3C73_885740 [compost metagenome]